MSTGIIKLIKQAAMDAVNNAQMCDWRYGKVVSTSPLKIQVTNQFVLPSSLLVVPQHLTDYEVECTYQPSINNLSGTTETSKELVDEEEPMSTHTHDFNVSAEGKTVTSKIKVHNALKVGDKVVLLRKQGGQSYFILDRI